MKSVVLETDAVGSCYDRVARFYDALNSLVEWFASKQRKKILQLARGDILEIGVGTGSSFKDYPPHRRIVAVDTSRKMLQRARGKIKPYDGSIKLRHDDVQHLSFTSETFDTVFASWVFCSVADPAKSLAEVRRVLKKHGRLLLLEHVRSRGRVLGYLMDRLNPLVAKFGVDNINRDTVENLRKAGFKIQQERNLAYDVVKAIIAVK